MDQSYIEDAGSMSPIGWFGCVIGKIVHPLEAPVVAKDAAVSCGWTYGIIFYWVLG